MTVRIALLNAHTALSASPSSSPRLDAELLVGHVLSLSRTQLLTQPHLPLSAAASQELENLIMQRASGTPIAYLLGRKGFMNLMLEVGPGTLVPRPETELVAEWAIERLRSINRGQSQLVIDVGTGAGAIALSIADAFRDSALQVVGCDISPGALQWAVRNRQQLGLSSRVDLVLGDLVQWLGSPATLIVANLPYLRPDQVRGSWETGNEPEIALVSGDDGLEVIRRLLADCGRVLAADGAIALEIDASQASRVSGMVPRFLPGFQPSVLPDLAGHDRFVVAVRR